MVLVNGPSVWLPVFTVFEVGGVWLPASAMPTMEIPAGLMPKSTLANMFPDTLRNTMRATLPSGATEMVCQIMR